MSEPYIIWTMRRTGGTTLAGLLSLLSEYPRIGHEPFNPDRALGDITRAWMADRDPDALYDGIFRALANRPVIKHCHELLGPEVNDCLMRVAIEKGYRHIVLDRRAEEDRILSLELAKATGAWGGKDAKAAYAQIEEGTLTPEPIDTHEGIRQLMFCQARRQELAEMMARHGQVPFVVYFEDVYSDPAEGRALIRRIVEFLNIDPAAHENYDALVDEALLTRGQNSARILEAVPNALALRARLQELLQDMPEPVPAS